MKKNKKIANIYLSGDPKIRARSVFFEDKKSDVKEKNKKQFITSEPATLTVIFDDETKLELFAPEGTIFDGATIPFNLGKGNMKFLIPALFHDIMCENKDLVGYDRKLADKIFRECLIKCNVNKFAAEVMYLNVEMYQKIFCKWNKEKK